LGCVPAPVAVVQTVVALSPLIEARPRELSTPSVQNMLLAVGSSVMSVARIPVSTICAALVAIEPASDSRMRAMWAGEKLRSLQ